MFQVTDEEDECKGREEPVRLCPERVVCGSGGAGTGLWSSEKTGC